MQNLEIDWKGVHILLKNLKIHKAIGPDEIPEYILKTSADELGPVLALQLSMDQGEIQDFQERRQTPAIKLQTWPRGYKTFFQSQHKVRLNNELENDLKRFITSVMNSDSETYSLWVWDWSQKVL